MWSLLFSIAPAQEWRTVALDDLEWITEAIGDNHPAPHLDDPVFAAQLTGGAQRAADEVADAADEPTARNALRRFVAGFQDGHLSLPVPWPERMGWAGWFVGLRGGEAVVVHTTEGGPPLGATLQSCDGRPVEAWLQPLLLDYTGDIGLQAHRAQMLPFLSLDEGVRSVPTTCDFDGQPLSLSWRVGEPSELYAAARVARFGVAPETLSAEPWEGGVWVTLPTFSPNELQRSALSDVKADAASWREAAFVVLDMRGNTGGDSALGTALVEALWGEGWRGLWAHPLGDLGRVLVHHRASPGNVEHYRGIVDAVRQRSGADEAASWREAVLEPMEQALKGGEPLSTYRWSRRRRAGGTRNPVSGPVYLLTDGHCGSACLDFADEVLGMPGATHIGAPTTADTVYMELRKMPLPGGRGRLNLPTKAYENRPRGHNVPYVPSAEFSYSGEWTDGALRAWVHALVEAR